MGYDNTARETELAGNLLAALRSSAFRTEFLRLAGIHEPAAEGRVETRMEYTPGDSNKRFDLYLRREDPNFRLAVELKRDETGLEEEQLREYLSLLHVLQPGGVLRRRRNAVRSAKLVVITGATEQPDVVSSLLEAGDGFLRPHLAWLSWFALMDSLLTLKEAGEGGEAVEGLWELLEQQGFVSGGSPLPRLRAAERLAPKLSAFAAQAEEREEQAVLKATLDRMEYQMAAPAVGYGVTVHVTKKKRNKIQVSRKRSINVGRPVKVLGHSVYAVGRAFLPTETIEHFIDAKRPGGQEAGVGIAFSPTCGAWLAFIKPFRGHALPEGFVKGLSSGSREVATDAGIQGWLLKGRQKQPESTARFLKRAWESYLESIGE